MTDSLDLKMNKRSKALLVDYRISQESIESLSNLGISVYKTTKINSVGDSLCGHADIQMHVISEKQFIVAAEAYEYYRKLFPYVGIIPGQKLLGPIYPDDILYNAAKVGEYLICNSPYTASEILSEYKSKGAEILNVKQGYAKCSVCVIGNNEIITADESIYKKAKSYNIDVLKISAGHIKLSGMNYGFFGGAAGMISGNVLAVNGNIDLHPDSCKIKSFCKKRGVTVISLNSGPICDIGSITPLF